MTGSAHDIVTSCIMQGRSTIHARKLAAWCYTSDEFVREKARAERNGVMVIDEPSYAQYRTWEIASARLLASLER